MTFYENLTIDHYDKNNNLIETVKFKNAPGSVFALCALLTLVQQNLSGFRVQAIAFGSRSSNLIVSASFCGTTPVGTIGNLIQSYSWGSYFALFRGTINFTSTMFVTDAQIGSGYNGTGAFNMFNYVYAYKNDVNSWYYPGDVAVVSWYLNISI